jgi:hypothetical protein
MGCPFLFGRVLHEKFRPRHRLYSYPEKNVGMRGNASTAHAWYF